MRKGSIRFAQKYLTLTELIMYLLKIKIKMPNKTYFHDSRFMESIVWSVSKKILKVNFVNVILAYQTWVGRHYIVMPLERKTKIIHSNLCKTTTLGITQKWLSWTGGRLIKHLYKILAWC